MADEKKETQERSYSVCKKFEVDLSDSGAITKLRDEFGKDAEIEVIVRIGRVMKKTPKEAIVALGQKKDLDGGYEVFSDSAVKSYEVETEMKREVSVK